MEQEEAIWLPNIKIVGLKEVLCSTDKENTWKGPQNANTQTYDTLQEHYDNNVPNFPSKNGRRRADERFAHDKVGEELAPDSTIWELYQEESKEFDSEMIEGRNKNLDTMLLFAGLFSAVVTTFLIESRNMLERDPAEASLALLLHIAQSQQRLEEGIPRAASAPVDIPIFEAQTYARWVNGLWFLSLGLSLCAALVAMLAKEWLTAFISSRPRSPRAYALLHQQRLEAWKRWYAFHVIDFLPTVLHFALLLFSVGLTIYLWTLDYVIAIVIMSVVGSTITFYIGTAIIAAKSQHWPYITQVSKYIRISFTSIPHTQIPEASLSRILPALHWLAENARDEATADCSYQALAGIKYPPRPGSSNISTGDDHLQLSILAGSQVHYGAIANMLPAVCGRISQALIPDNKPLSPSEGFSVSRYASALPHLVKHLESGFIESLSQPRWTVTPSRSALAVLDYAWSKNSRYLTADAITLLTATEIRLTEIAVSHNPSIHFSAEMVAMPQRSENLDSISTQDCVATNTVGLEMGRIPLFEVRARFSRALFRAGIELCLYADGFIDIRADSLTHLLDSIRLGLLCSVLNPNTSLSTHQSQGVNTAPPSKLASTIAGVGTSKSVRRFDIGDKDGLLVSLMRVACLTDFTESPELVRAATHTLSIASPVLLQQWINLSAERSGGRQKALRVLDFWSGIPDMHTLDAFDLGTWNSKQLLAIAWIDSLCAGCRGAGMISAHAFQILYQFASKGTLGQNSSKLVAQNNFLAIHEILQSLRAGEEKANVRVLRPLIQWLNIVAYPSGKTILHAANEKYDHAIRAFLNVWAQVPGLHDELDCFVGRILKGHMGDPLGFLEGLDYLPTLATIGKTEAYGPTLTKLIVHLIVLFLGDVPESQGWEQLCSIVSLPHFLQVVGVALNVLSSSGHEHLIIAESFARAASTFQRHIRTETMPIHANLYEQAILDVTHQDRSVLPMICQVLRDRLVSFPIANILLPEYEEFIQRLDDPEAWLYQPIAGLFEQNDFSAAGHGERLG